MNNDFLVTPVVICQCFSLVTSSLVKIIGKSPHSWPKIVIHGNSCIILYIFNIIFFQPNYHRAVTTFPLDPYGIYTLMWCFYTSVVVYYQTCNIRQLSNKIVDHSHVVEASGAGAAPTTSSFSTWHLASMDWAKTTAKRDEKHLSLRIWCTLY